MTTKRRKLRPKLKFGTWYGQRWLNKNAISVDSTNVTLEQWGDTMSVKDTAKSATFVKYNRTDIPLMQLAKCPDKVSRAALDTQYNRAEDAIRSKGYMESQLKDSQLELSKARVLIERMARRLLDNGEL